MKSHHVSIEIEGSSGQFVSDGLFGANALYGVNMSDEGSFAPSPGFVNSVRDLGITDLRYPGGHAENTIDITRLENGKLRPEVRAFMQWCQEQGSAGKPMMVTIVLPTKTDLPAEQVERFVFLLLEEFGENIAGFEIGNEYSIGKSVPDPDRSTHPEQDPDSDFISSMTEKEYGIAANRVINATARALSDFAERYPGRSLEPQILIQMGDTNGAGSSFKGNGTFEMANEEILSWLDATALAAIDGSVAHYYYNKQHEYDQAFSHEWQEHRSLDGRFDHFNEVLGRDAGFYITEWNVLTSNPTQVGAASASVLIEMFEFMVQAGVEEAFVWPLQHRTQNNIAGNRSSEASDLSMAGGAFQMLSQALRPVVSTTGYVERFESIYTDSLGHDGSIEANLFSSAYHDIIFVSLRDLEPAQVFLNLQDQVAQAVDIDVTLMTIDPASSDGLSDLSNDNGQDRLRRRYIDEEEMQALSRLPFFDPERKDHIVDLGNGQFQTYLPPISTIVPLVENPQFLEDYYFPTETDVDPLLTTIQHDFTTADTLPLNMLPYDVAMVSIEKYWRQEASAAAEVIRGGIGKDIILGREGDDTIYGGEDADTLKGGAGDDWLFSGLDDDRLVGSFGIDILVGEHGSDTLLGGEDADLLIGDRSGLFGTESSEEIFRLYRAVFDRDPDINSHFLWSARLASGATSLKQVISGFSSSAEYKKAFEGSSDQNFVTSLYLNVFDRVPRQADVDAWVENLLSGMSREDVILHFSESDEHRLRTQVGLELFEERFDLTKCSQHVYRLYQAILDRDPDAEGFSNWVDNLSTGRIDFPGMIDAFMGSPEFQNTYEGADNEAFVTLLYANVLDRNPDTGGLNAWLAQLGNGMSRRDVVQHFASSIEFVQRTEAGMSLLLRSLDPDDVLQPGEGDSTLSGGLYSDTFVFSPGDTGRHIITDMEAWDQLDLAGFDYTDLPTALSHFVQNGQDIFFQDAGVTIVLKNWDLGDLANDMLYLG